MVDNDKLPVRSNKEFVMVWQTEANYKKNKLTPDKITALEEIEHWYWDLDTQWFEKCASLKQYMVDNGKLPVQSNKEFGTWCNTQRQNYKKNKLTPDKITALEEIEHWYWEIDLDTQWFEKSSLKQYVVDNGKLPVRSNKEFGMWCNTQRQNYKKNKLTPDKITALEEIEHWYWSKK